MELDDHKIFDEFTRRLQSVYDAEYNRRFEYFVLSARARKRGSVLFEPPIMLHLTRISLHELLKSIVRGGGPRALFSSDDPTIGALRLVLVHLDEIVETKTGKGKRNIVVAGGRLAVL